MILPTNFICTIDLTMSENGYTTTYSSFNCFIIAAITADGFIGKDSAHLSTKWASQEDAAFYRQKSTEAGVIIMGSNTFNTIGKALPKRVNLVYSHQAPDGSKVLESADKLVSGEIYYTALSPHQIRKKLQAHGFNSLAVSGGASVYQQFMASGEVSELWLTIEPVIFGDGLRLFSADLGQIPLELVETIPLSPQSLVLRYQVKRVSAPSMAQSIAQSI